jgi:hypothetical protein
MTNQAFTLSLLLLLLLIIIIIIFIIMTTTNLPSRLAEMVKFLTDK